MRMLRRQRATAHAGGAARPKAVLRSAPPQAWAALAVSALALFWLLFNTWRARRA